LPRLEVYLTGVTRRLIVGYYNDSGDQAFHIVGTSTTAVAVNAWYRVELKFVITSGNTDLIAMRVAPDDDNAVPELITSAANLNVSSGPPKANIVLSNMPTPGPAPSYVVWDDWKISDDTVPAGLTSTDPRASVGWPGPGRVYLLKPIADDAIGSWKDVDGTSATSAWNELDDRPPDIDDPLSGPYVSVANSNLDERCQSPAAAGITDPTIVAMQPAVVFGYRTSPGIVGVKLLTPTGTEATAEASGILVAPAVHAPPSDEPVVRVRRSSASGEPQLAALGVLVDTSPVSSRRLTMVV
jgi:hypothetical protein